MYKKQCTYPQDYRILYIIVYFEDWYTEKNKSKKSMRQKVN